MTNIKLVNAFTKYMGGKIFPDTMEAEFDEFTITILTRLSDTDIIRLEFILNKGKIEIYFSISWKDDGFYKEMSRYVTDEIEPSKFNFYFQEFFGFANKTHKELADIKTALYKN